MLYAIKISEMWAKLTTEGRAEIPTSKQVAAMKN